MSKFLNGIDLTLTELKNVCVQSLAVEPVYKEAQLFYNPNLKSLRFGSNGIFDSILMASQRATASGLATLDNSSLVIQNPVNAQQIAAANKMPIAGANGKLDPSWLSLGAGNGIDADKLDGQEGTYYLDRANHTGTQLASTVSDFDTQVRLSRLDQLAIPTNALNINNQVLNNVGTPVLPTDGVNAAYVDSKIQGLGPKFNVRVATTANIMLSGTQTIDDIAVVANDLVLVKNQTTASQNGIYTVAAGAWSRTTSADTWTELVNAYCFIQQGTTNADCGFVCTVDAGGTLNTTSVTWIQFSAAGQLTASNVNTLGVGVFKQKNGLSLEFRGINAASTKLTTSLNATSNTIDIDIVEANLSHANIGGITAIANGGTGGSTAAAAKTNLGFTTKYAANIGDGISTSIVVTHNLNSMDVCVEVYETASPFTKVYPDILHTSINTITVGFTNAPTINQYKVVVIG